MSSPSPPPFVSSADASQSDTRLSKFTHKQLDQLAAFSTTTPLRTVAHIDLDAFYAQCEGVRLGIADDQPLAVQQWQALIAVNYPARPFGVGRHITASEAKKLCPDIILQHVATWKEGDGTWAYRESSTDIKTQKVSLDPYRIESKKILSVIKETLPPAPVQRIEKAGIDEVFVDLSSQVHSILTTRFPMLQRSAYHDSNDHLPLPPPTALEWAADSLVEPEGDESESDNLDWDDVCLSIAGEIVHEVRTRIRQRLRYTCSAGIARNKMLAKLGSGYHKPNGQTVIRNRAIQRFLRDFKVTKIRNLGGRLGDEVVSLFQTDSVKDLLEVSLDELKKLGDGPGTWVYETIRGCDNSEVNSRTDIKSMLSAKSFRPSVNSLEHAVKWLRIFIADLRGRCSDEGVLENKRRPKTISVLHRQACQSKSKRCAIPLVGTVTESMLLELATHLLAQLVAEGRAWPCSHLSITLGGFEDTISGNMGIDGFMTGRSSRTPAGESGNASDECIAGKRKRPGVDTEDGETDMDEIPEPREYLGVKYQHQEEETFRCDLCKRELANEVRLEHEDWHYAKELEQKLRHEVPPDDSNTQKSKERKDAKATKKQPPQKRVTLSKGQQRLVFQK
jgi:DNA polymerase eta